MPSAITWVMRPLSTCLPEKMREMAMPAAISVKKMPVPFWIPISFAYIAT